VFSSRTVTAASEYLDLTNAPAIWDGEPGPANSALQRWRRAAELATKMHRPSSPDMVSHTPVSLSQSAFEPTPSLVSTMAPTSPQASAALSLPAGGGDANWMGSKSMDGTIRKSEYSGRLYDWFANRGRSISMSFLETTGSALSSPYTRFPGYGSAGNYGPDSGVDMVGAMCICIDACLFATSVPDRTQDSNAN